MPHLFVLGIRWTTLGSFSLTGRATLTSRKAPWVAWSSIPGGAANPISAAHAVPSDNMSEFFKVSQSPIHELEVFPVFVAIAMCGAGDTKVPWLSTFVNYIDNESARMAYICGSGETTFSSRHIADFVDAESQLQHRSWFGRCPSASNPADGASRLDLTWFEGRNVEHTKLSWEELRHQFRLSGERPGRRWLRPICRVWKKEWQTSIASFLRHFHFC